MKPVFIGVREIFPTVHVPLRCRKNACLALKRFSRRALHYGGTVHGKISDAPLCEATFSCYVDLKAKGVGRQ